MSDKNAAESAKKASTKASTKAKQSPAAKKNLLKAKQQQSLNLSSSVSRTSKLLRWCLYSSLKLTIALLLGLVIYTIYLDGKVKQKFEGQRWHIPIQIYGQIEQLSLNQPVNLKHLAESLRLTGYKKFSL